MPHCFIDTMSSGWPMKSITLQIEYYNEYEIDLFGETLRFTEMHHLNLGHLGPSYSDILSIQWLDLILLAPWGA